MTYLDDAAIRAAGLRTRTPSARASGQHDNRAAHRAHPRTAPREGRRCSASPISPTWCSTIAWRTPASTPCSFLERSARRRPSAASSGERGAARSSAARSKAPERRDSSPGTSPTTPRSSAPRSTTSTRRRCARTSRWSAWSPGMFETRAAASTASAWKRSRACPSGIRRCSYYDVRDAERHASWAAFYADWYPRENKRGGAWMDALHHRRSRDRRLPPAPRPDLRQPDAARRRQARAAHAPRGGDHLPRVRPPAAPLAEPRRGPAPGRHQRGLGLRRTALADHGELVLGARGARPVRPPLRDRRSPSPRSCSRR